MTFALTLCVIVSCVVLQFAENTQIASVGPNELLTRDDTGDVDFHWTSTGPLVIRAAFHANVVILQGRVIPLEIAEGLRAVFVARGYGAKDILHVEEENLGTEVKIPHKAVHNHGLADALVVEFLLKSKFQVLSSSVLGPTSLIDSHQVMWFIYNNK